MGRLDRRPKYPPLLQSPQFLNPQRSSNSQSRKVSPIPESPTIFKLLIPKRLVFQVSMGDAECLPSGDPSARLPAYTIKKDRPFKRLNDHIVILQNNK
ncbi:unnamed protein product [Spodoptera littoralis]|uniref:Uncharacterized protein n=1 Tax=Spodoptera littoralis TaxID=7109 RepID=A0A9P0N2K5_SPOLI|nr:unnamed protein product [Spodoptera littoralis]CAH1642346.1 unnamed protein product [Spodoptera littoralis]